MYTVTFYSFKGGVGRTMAMVNVAHDLVARGRRVLIVDFDLEAPGADTFAFAGKSTQRDGIVDYVHEFLRTNRAPAIRPYVHCIETGADSNGKLWLMPSGRETDEYAKRLGEIDWADIYDRRDGFLLFENLKSQWYQEISPDYVFIDSRTGHTDVGGICTRQLPDAVVVLFFPNDQNLRGLRKVVRDIRAEKETVTGKPIELHFAMSNVPDLDDEDEILRTRIEGFRAELEPDSPLHVIHRYDSLALLNQDVFVKARPKSRLAREYRSLTDAIIQANPADRQGAIQRLKEAQRRRGPRSRDFFRYASAVKANFSSDGEILFELSEAYRSRGLTDLALASVTSAIELGYTKAEAYIARAELARDSFGDFISALNLADIGCDDVIRAMEGLRAAPEAVLVEASRTPGWLNLPHDERDSLGLTWRNSRHELMAATILFSPFLVTTVPIGQVRDIRHILSFAYIGLGELTRAIEMLDAEVYGERGTADSFNLAMALWCRDGAIREDLLNEVVSACEADGDSERFANTAQCMAIAYHLLNQADRAYTWLRRAKTLGANVRNSATSCWRFLDVSASEFLADIDEIEQLLSGRDVKPRFLTGSAPI